MWKCPMDSCSSGVNCKGVAISMVHTVWDPHCLCLFSAVTLKERVYTHQTNAVLTTLLQNEYMLQEAQSAFWQNSVFSTADVMVLLLIQRGSPFWFCPRWWQQTEDCYLDSQVNINPNASLISLGAPPWADWKTISFGILSPNTAGILGSEVQEYL